MLEDFYLELNGKWYSSGDIDNSIRRVLKEGAANKELVPERVEVLGDVFVGIHKITGKIPKMKFRPAFATGSVSVDVSELQLDREQSKMLAEILRLCSTFEVIPLVSGKIRISATINRMFYTE